MITIAHAAPLLCLENSHSSALTQEEFPEAYRFTVSVFPSKDDDVITSPYNALLSLAELTEHADAVFPLENQALMDMCTLIQSRAKPSANQAASLLSGPNAGGQSGHCLL